MGLVERARELPTEPGVYLFKNERHEIIYIGKAKRLRSRVRSYFRSGSDKRASYELITSQVADFDFVGIETGTAASPRGTQHHIPLLAVGFDSQAIVRIAEMSLDDRAR